MSATEIKQELEARAEDFVRWLLPRGKRRGHEWLIGSVAGEPGESLSVCVSGNKVGVWCDFSTGQKGDNLVELLLQTRGLEFKDGIRVCRDWLGLPAESVSSGSSVFHSSKFPKENSMNEFSKPTPNCTTDGGLPKPMSDQDNRRALAMAQTILDDPALCERIARSRGWRPETIEALAGEPSLGWHEGKLAFLYESGVKLRWRQAQERIIKWAFGEPWLWRGGFIWRYHRIFLCEGETDAISLINSGVEADGQSTAIAVPSATTFKETWIPLFKGKEVILVLDDDQAGVSATSRIGSMLQPVVNSLSRFNWEGLRRAS